ncbi:MAG: hypothetical protein ACKOA9_14385 [Actinomycetota bacterium]
MNIGPGGKVVYAGSVGTSVTVTGLTGGESYRCHARALRAGLLLVGW